MSSKGLASKKNVGVNLERCVNRDAAGIDLGSRSHYVALPRDRGEKVREFGCRTHELEKMADYLLKHGIKSVAMESTGVYWVPVFQILETAGLDVSLVNSQHLKIVPGRKTDVSDCQWLQLLHEAGLLQKSFRPEDQICALRSILRHRDTLAEESNRHLLRIQKALEQMNIQLHKTVASIAGETGMAIIRDIVGGERDAEQLARHRNYRCRQTPQDFAHALRGDWREEHLFCLAQSFANYQHLEAQVAACDTEISRRMQQLPSKADPQAAPVPTKKKADLPTRLDLYQALGHDLTAIEGIGVLTLQKLIGEVGTDVDAWPTAKHFASWARVCAGNNVTGGRRRRVQSGVKHRVAQIFREAAAALGRSATALGAFYRRKRAARGPMVAIGATAHKLAQRFYYMLKHGRAYVPLKADYYEQKHAERIATKAVKTLQRLGRADLLAAGAVC